MRAALGPLLGKGHACRSLHVGGAAAPHARVREYVNSIGLESWNDLYSFAVIRDPYARAVSCWAYAKDTGAPYVKRFREWVAGGFKLNGRYYLTVSPERKAWMHASQVEWLEYAGKIAVSRLLRFEQLDRDWQFIESELGVEALEPKNQSDHYAVHRYYDERTRALVYERYKEDFKILGYEP